MEIFMRQHYEPKLLPLRQGLLTYALMREGLEKKQADGDGDGKTTLDEWLKYGERRVPRLYEDVRAGRVKEIKSRDAEITMVVTGKSVKKNAFQQPQIFNFKKTKREVVLTTILTPSIRSRRRR